jgi:hypothetical protein
MQNANDLNHWFFFCFRAKVWFGSKKLKKNQKKMILKFIKFIYNFNVDLITRRKET